MIKSARTVGLSLVILCLVPVAFGQSSALSFEVASIKVAEPITPAKITSGKLHVGMSVDASRVDIGSLSLAELVPMAFKLKPYQVSGPDWMGAQRFDILAKLPEGASKEQVPEMLQGLLEERFQLKAHRENREHSVYALVVGKGGSKLKEAPPDTDVPVTDGTKPVITFGAGQNKFQVNADRGGATVVSPERGTTKVAPGPDGQMRLEMSKMTMAGFADLLTRFLDRPVVDMTELKGNYQVALDLSMENLVSVARAAGVGVPGLGARGEPGRPIDAADPSGGSVFASVQQLGLRLEPRKAPVEFIVIDHLEKTPTEN